MKTIITSLLLLLGSTLFAQTTLRSKHYNLKDGLAIKGYDPVAYFKENKAVKGKKEYAATVDGVTYYFYNITNKILFTREPQKYEPQYGGWCAYAMGATGEKVEIDPETFKVINGKLYLFYNRLFNNTLTKWNKDENNLKAAADKNWTNLYK